MPLFGIAVLLAGAALAVSTAPASAQSGSPVAQVDAVLAIQNTTSGKCLEISDSSSDNGEKAQQWSCLGQPGMYWRFQSAGGGAYTIVNINSGKCLEISDSSRDDGEIAQQWSCLGQPGMYWQFLSAGNGQYNIVNINSGKCLEIPGGSLYNGTKVYQWTCLHQLAIYWIW